LHPLCAARETGDVPAIWVDDRPRLVMAQAGARAVAGHRSHGKDLGEALERAPHEPNVTPAVRARSSVRGSPDAATAEAQCATARGTLGPHALGPQRRD